jgi:hypothetical protein
MSSYPRWRRASQSSKLSYTIKSSHDEVKTDYDTKKVAVHSSADDAAISNELTLDDFGGRSDALGG